MAGVMQGGGPGQPHATEYTLQGVMRFLQTEWHRHERDRNAWEIDRQEMKSRIATLEGQARRSDATQKALKKYVSILQNKVREQAVQLSGREAPISPQNGKDIDERAAKIKEKLKSAEKSTVDPLDPDVVDDDAQRSDLKTFLDNCHSEFTYLMITPTNPVPPRESPQLPLDDLREGDMINLAGSQPPFAPAPNRFTANHIMDMASRQPGPNHTQGQQQPLMNNAPPPRQHEPHQPSPMIRSVSEHPQSMFGNNQPDWGSVRGEESNSRQGTVDERLLDKEHASELANKADTLGNDAWDLDFPQPANTHTTPKRPDTDVFPSADNLPRSPGRSQSGSRRKGSMSRKRSVEHELSLNASPQKSDSGNFKLRYGLRGHLSTVRTVIFSGGGSPGEPEICTAGDDGTVKRFLVPRLDGLVASDHDVKADFTHRGHTGAVLSVTSWSPSPSFSTGGRAQGDGWIFSGGQDATIRVWERGRVDPKATLEGHTDAVWALCVLPVTLGAVFGQSNSYGPADRILLVSGAADGTVRLWSVSAPPQLSSPQPSINSARLPGSRGRVRGNSMSSGSAFPATPQPTMASNSPFHHTLIHTLVRPDGSTASPTCIAPLSPSGESFVVSYADAAVLVFDSRSGEQIASMTSLETYDGTQDTAVNAVAATTIGFDQGTQPGGSGEDEDGQQRATGPTGGSSSMGSGFEGTIISGHEDRGFVRFYDANSGQCTYNMVAHPAAISSLSLSPDGRELVTAGHDASLRFWNLENRTCIQEITTHRIMRGEGVCAVVWSQDGRWVVSGGGDGVVKVFAR